MEEQRKKEKMEVEQGKEKDDEKGLALELRRELLKRMLAEQKIFRERRASNISEEEEVSRRDQFPPSLGPGETGKSRPDNTKDRLAQSLRENGRLRPPPVPKQVTSTHDEFPPSLGHRETGRSRPDSIKDRLGPPPIQLRSEEVTSSRDQFPPSLGPGEPNRSRHVALEESGRLAIQVRSASRRDQFPPLLGAGETDKSRPVGLEERDRLGPPPLQPRSKRAMSHRDQFPRSLRPEETRRSRLTKVRDTLPQPLGESGRLRPPPVQPRSETVKSIPSHPSGPRITANAASRGQQSDSQSRSTSRSRGHHRSREKNRKDVSEPTSDHHVVARRRGNDQRPAQQHRLRQEVKCGVRGQRSNVAEDQHVLSFSGTITHIIESGHTHSKKPQQHGFQSEDVG